MAVWMASERPSRSGSPSPTTPASVCTLRNIHRGLTRNASRVVILMGVLSRLRSARLLFSSPRVMPGRAIVPARAGNDWRADLRVRAFVIFFGRFMVVVLGQVHTSGSADGCFKV